MSEDAEAFLRSRPRSASAAGASRITLPYRPPLPTSSPRALVSSSTTRGRGRRRARCRPGRRTRCRPSGPCRARRRPPGAARRASRSPLQQPRAEPGRVALQVVVEQVVEQGRAPGRGDRVAAEGGDRVRAEASPSRRRGRPRRRSRGRCRGPWRRSACPARRRAPGMPQKCSPVRPQPVCTSSEMNRMPCSSSTSLNAPKKPSGGVAKPPTPWIGSAIMHATSPEVGLSSTSRRSSTQAVDVVGVGQTRNGPRSR